MTIPNSAFSITVDSNGNLGFYNLSSGSEIAYLTPSGQFNSDSYNLSAGSGISLSGNTIENTGVLSLQGSTGALSLVAGTGIGISGLTISNTGIVSLSAGDGISVSGSTIAMSGTYDANMLISGILETQYINANSGNENPNGSTPTMIVSIYGAGEGSAILNAYGIGISNSTLDFITASSANFAWWQGSTQIASMNSSGDMSISGSLTASGGFISNGSLALDLGDSVGVRALVYDTSGTAGYQTGYGVNVVGTNSLDFFIGYGNGSNTSFNIGSGGNDTYPYTSYNRLFTVANTGEVTTVKNTLDNGSGDMTIIGNTTLGNGGSQLLYLQSNFGGTSPFGSSVSQGSYFGWNYTSTTGGTEFFNQYGGGTGGFYFYNVSGNGGLTQLTSINGSGDMSIAGSLTVPDYIYLPTNSSSGGGVIIGNSNSDLAYVSAGLLLSNAYGSSTSNQNYTQLYTSTQTLAGVEGNLLSIAVNDVKILFAMDFNGDLGIAGNMSASGNLSVNGGINVPYPPQQYTATGTFNTGQVSFSAWTIMVVLGSYNIGASSQSISSVGISATVQEYNDGGSTNIVILVTNNSLSVNDTISPSSTNILGYFTLTGGDSSTSTMYTTNGVISGLSNSSTIYLYVACGNTGYTHTVSFSNVWVR